MGRVKGVGGRLRRGVGCHEGSGNPWTWRKAGEKRARGGALGGGGKRRKGGGGG